MFLIFEISGNEGMIEFIIIVTTKVSRIGTSVN